MYSLQDIRKDFPILSRKVYNHPLVYLDNGATTQKPKQVVEAMVDEYYNVNANVHRGVHFLSQQATELHESSREAVRAFINARSSSEILFTRGTTESINLLAFTFGEAFIHADDEIIVSTMEHHSNIVPWQMMCQRKGAILRVIPMTNLGTLDLDAYQQQVYSLKEKIFSLYSLILRAPSVRNISLLFSRSSLASRKASNSLKAISMPTAVMQCEISPA